jgi:hypothetical protein
MTKNKGPQLSLAWGTRRSGARGGTMSWVMGKATEHAECQLKHSKQHFYELNTPVTQVNLAQAAIEFRAS